MRSKQLLKKLSILGLFLVVVFVFVLVNEVSDEIVINKHQLKRHRQELILNFPYSQLELFIALKKYGEWKLKLDENGVKHVAKRKLYDSMDLLHGEWKPTTLWQHYIIFFRRINGRDSLIINSELSDNHQTNNKNGEIVIFKEEIPIVTEQIIKILSKEYPIEELYNIKGYESAIHARNSIIRNYKLKRVKLDAKRQKVQKSQQEELEKWDRLQKIKQDKISEILSE
tara:strand:- start:224 stop:904 length:681 start_codon:yes stop_codon:yes gene_type:complete